MLVDWPLEQLRKYAPEREEPGDFDSFWAATRQQARDKARPAEFVPYDAGLATVEVFDVTYSGFDGQPVRGWFVLPRGTEGPLPCVVQYIGYNGARGLAHEWLTWSAAGYAHFVMDTRGQGSNGSQAGDTPDPDPSGTPQTPGFMTRGVTSPEAYYYRRVFTDAVRAVDTVRDHPAVDPARVVVSGGSQGGGIALAAAGLSDGLAGVLVDVPFLCHYRRATEITNEYPYGELVAYLKTHRDQVDQVFTTLSYCDGVNFAARATAPTLFSVALMDAVCPPSTVFAAYNHYAGQKEITVWPYNGHEGGGAFNVGAQLRYVAKLLA
ncbi:acetylxylan esterase [Paractinoplanes rishiriensis]|uniref:Cephalosporin-C deacetylase n=1 Tax=Paractinoplanes rishiriensis TaxID=1050105 RepID=A0A919K2D9_9ACTN|nr:alpha/beta fold hydrolase [Actinoplanes rishiriensis]GIE95366.1 cephalosporin-C deacetylase [Actinoplanes rishiriensis]